MTLYKMRHYYTYIIQDGTLLQQTTDVPTRPDSQAHAMLCFSQWLL